MIDETDTETPPPVPAKTKSAGRPSSTTINHSTYTGTPFENNDLPLSYRTQSAIRPRSTSISDRSIYSSTSFENVGSCCASTTTVHVNAVECSSIPAGFEDFDTISNSSKSSVDRDRTTEAVFKNHVVKILINPEETVPDRNSRTVTKTLADSSYGKAVFDQNSNNISNSIGKRFLDNKCYGGFVSAKSYDSVSKTNFTGLKGVRDNVSGGDVSPCVRISVNNSAALSDNNMVDTVGQSSPFYFYSPFNGVMSSGQVSPSDTLDSGTCSDMDGTPPPLPKKKNGSGISVTIIGNHKKATSCSSGVDVDSDNDSNNSSLSCDSLNFGNSSRPASKFSRTSSNGSQSSTFSHILLQDIRQRINSKDSDYTDSLVDEKSYTERQEEARQLENLKIKEEVLKGVEFNTDMFYKFHLNEKDVDEIIVPVKSTSDDESFAGYKDLLGNGAATIRSAKGTVRGVKNRVRAGIATFLQINNNERSYKEKDGNKVVVYTTTMGIIRDTYQACMKVKQIMRTLLVKFEERDVFMSSEYQTEIRERMKCDHILVPQVYVDGQHIGDAETIERLNESGELRTLLKPYKSPDACSTCQVCGGYRLLPCHVCNGSKKSVHRNHFTTEFVALKCMSCDDAGLVKCTACFV